MRVAEREGEREVSGRSDRVLDAEGGGVTGGIWQI